MRWRTVPREALIWRELDGELVVRNELTGSTHLLGPLASEVLRTLLSAGSALTAAELAGRVCDDPSAIETILSELERLALAEPGAC